VTGGVGGGWGDVGWVGLDEQAAASRPRVNTKAAATRMGELP